MLFLVYNTSFDKSILTLKTCLCAIIFLGKKGEKHEKEKAFKKENKKPFDSCVRFTVVLRAKCKNVANKMQKIGFKKRHFKRLLNAK